MITVEGTFEALLRVFADYFAMEGDLRFKLCENPDLEFHV
jgi:hypothetical protein